MSRRATVHEADIARAIRAAIQAGLKPGEFEVRMDAECVRIITFASAQVAPVVEEQSEWTLHLAPGAAEARKAKALAVFRKEATMPDRAVLTAAFKGKNSLPVPDVARLLKMKLHQVDAAQWADVLVRSRAGGGPARFTEKAILEAFGIRG